MTQPDYTWADVLENEDVARLYLEGRRWPNGPRCAHCGGDNVGRLVGGSVRKGVFKCRECRRPFTVTVATGIVAGHLPLNKVAAAAFMFAAGWSTARTQRSLEISYNAAWRLSQKRALLISLVGVPDPAPDPASLYPSIGGSL